MTTTTTEKYLLRKALHAVKDEPECLHEHDALKIIVSAAGGTVCLAHAASVVAAHIAGPVAAVPPEGHGLHADLSASGRGLLGSVAVNRLIVEAGGLPDPNAIRCRYEDDMDDLCPDAHPMTVLVRHFCQGRMARPHSWGIENQKRVEDALQSRDVDRMVHALCPRTWALVGIVDRARATAGGDLPVVVIEAAVTLLRTLAGPRRWDVRSGWARGEFPPEKRWTALADDVDQIMRADFVFDRLVLRVIEGA